MKNTNNKWVVSAQIDGSEEVFDIKCFDNRKDALNFMNNMGCARSYFTTKVINETLKPKETPKSIKEARESKNETILDISYVVEINLHCDWIFYGKYYDEVQATRVYNYLTKRKNICARVFKNIKELVE